MRKSDPTSSTASAGHFDLRCVAVRVGRKTGAELVTHHFFPASPRTLEAWPLTWRRVNGKALCETEELFALARAKLNTAPQIRGGRRSTRLAD